jgi:hypothetical protein
MITSDYSGISSQPRGTIKTRVVNVYLQNKTVEKQKKSLQNKNKVTLGMVVHL